MTVATLHRQQEAHAAELVKADAGGDGCAGSSQLSITMDIYGHVMPEALRDAADGMGRALAGE